MRLLVVLFIVSSWGSAAGAQDEPPADYRELFRQGSRQWGEDHFREARALFERAHETYPNARSHRALGLVLFELRDYPGCVEHLSAALSDTRRALNERLRQDPERVLREASALVGELEIRTREGAFLTIDGVARTTRVVLLARGEHTVDVTAFGFRAERRQVQVAGGSQQVLTVELTPASTAGTSDEPPMPDLGEPEFSDPAPTQRSPAFGLGVGTLSVGGGLLIAGVVAHLFYNNAQNSYDQSVEMGGCMAKVDGSVPETEDRDECLDFQTQWQHSRPWMLVGYGLGSGLLAVGVVLAIVGRGSDEESEALACTAYADLGVSCAVRF